MKDMFNYIDDNFQLLCALITVSILISLHLKTVFMESEMKSENQNLVLLIGWIILIIQMVFLVEN